MKIQINKQPRGSVLLVSLVLAAIILTSVGSYLYLVCNENRAVSRSQGWDACLPVMEAGVEEALTQIHYGGIANLGNNNWTLGADGNYHKTRNVGTNGAYCNITIQPASPPTIYSEAYVPAPMSTNYVLREVRVGLTGSSGPAGRGLTAKGAITFGGQGGFDSYNSANGPYVSGVHGTNGVVLTDTNCVAAINVTGGDIYGMCVTGPNGTVACSGGSTAVGAASWISAKNIGIEPGWTANDANVNIGDVAVPYTSGTIPPANVKVGSTTYAYLLDGAKASQYYMSTLSLTATMLVTNNVTLYVTGSFNTSGQGVIILAPKSTLKLYVGGTTSIGGQGIVNQSQIPASFSMYGVPSCTSITYAGSANFYGTVDAPEALLTFSGASSEFGAYVAAAISVGGQGGVHYDEGLGSTQTAYAMSSWNEIAPQ